MEAISVFIKVSLPSYLSNLPIPDSIGGFAQLKGYEWVSLAIFFVTVAIIFCALLKLVLPSLPKRPPQINQEVKKDNPKVVDLLEIEDLDQEKITYCRCWRSSKFPLCDGSHNKHNEETGDNVGPLVIRRKEKK